MSQIKVGLIGFGLAGSVFHAPLIAAEPRMRLTAAATSRKLPEEFASAKTFASAEEMIASPDIDLVVIASPNTSHAPLARASLMTGKHVVIDKPFALNTREAQSLVDLAQLKGKMLTVFQNRRWDGNFLTVQSLLGEGAIGDVRYCEIHYDRFQPSPKVGWRETRNPGAGILYDLGPHLMDQALCLFGKPKRISADVTAQRDGVLVDDYFHIVLTYCDMRVVVHASTLVAKAGPRFVAHGTTGSLYQYGMDEQEPQLAKGMRPGDAGWGDAPEVTVEISGRTSTRAVTPKPGAYECFYRAVADTILGQAPPPVTTDEALVLMSMLDAARQSAVEGRRIAIP